MNTIKIAAGETIHKNGDMADTFELLVQGTVTVNVSGINLTLKKGSILGILETAGSPYSYDYVANEDAILCVYPFTRFSDIDNLVKDNFSTCDVLINAFSHTLCSLASQYRKLLRTTERGYNTLKESYDKYKKICSVYDYEIKTFPFLEITSEFVPERDIPDWVSDFYDQLEIMPKDAKLKYFGTHTSLITAAIWEAASHASLYLSLCAQLNSYINDTVSQYMNSPSGDMLDLFTDLKRKVISENPSSDALLEIESAVCNLFDEFEGTSLISSDDYRKKIEEYQSITFQKNNDDSPKEKEKEKNAFELIDNSLSVILKYASMDEAEEERFSELISQYRKVQDKNSSDDEIRKLRLEITKSFFDIYEAAMCSSFESSNLPTILKMFFYFGYMDENLIGKENALKLYKLAEDFEATETENVMSAYKWLHKIYDSEEEPSKNEFDQDFPAFLKSQRAGGYITAEMEQRYLSSPKEKMRFELRNFFKTALKISSGRPSTFCPVLSDHNIIKPLETIMSTAKKISTNWSVIKAVDYSCFFRECSFQAPEYKISRETIMLEVIPTTILMPGIGSKSILWQETSGVRRDTAGRIAVPIFSNEELLSMQIKLAGEFRWEICKKIQGARWNDVTDHSLTSEYFDYLQFFKKNNELSPDAKEKIKTAVSNAKNNFRNVFVQDYFLWIKYEALGSPRLNRVAKQIMFTYCPFSKVYRDKLRNNPMYTDMIIRHEAKNQKKGKPLEAHYQKIASSNGTNSLPPEIKNYIEYFSL